MGLVSGDDSEIGVIPQASARVQGSIGIFDFTGGFHISDSQLMFVNESLADEALSGSTVEEGLNGDLLLRCLQCNGYAHCIACHAGFQCPGKGVRGFGFGNPGGGQLSRGWRCHSLEGICDPVLNCLCRVLQVLKNSGLI